MMIGTMYRVNVTTSRVHQFQHSANSQIVSAAALLNGFQAERIGSAFLHIMRRNRPYQGALTSGHANDRDAITIRCFGPIIVNSARVFNVNFARPSRQAATAWDRRRRIITMNKISAPLLIQHRRIRHFFQITIKFLTCRFFRQANISQQAVGRRTFARVARPLIVLVRLLAAERHAP